MGRYILSEKTQEDIDAIYDYGSARFGKKQSLNYLIELRSHFELLSTYPEIGRRRDEIKDGLFSFSYAAHVIFYRILQEHIRIVRVLHGSRDLRRFIE